MTTTTKHGLGRGLGALIPPHSLAPGHIPSGIHEIDPDHIEPNPQQPRKRMAPDALAALAASIREHGLLQPLLVKEIPSIGGARYQLIAGERRWRAAQSAGLRSVPAIVKGASSQQMLELALVENLQRADLNVLEEAEAYRQLIEEFHLTQEQVANRVGKDRVTVSNALRLLKLPNALKEAVLNETISEGHARALLQLDDETQQNKLLAVVIEQNLSVRQTEELVRRTLAGAHQRAGALSHSGRTGNARTRSSRHPSPDTHHLEDQLRRALGTKVELHRSRRGGKIIIEFYSDEELDALYHKLIGA